MPKRVDANQKDVVAALGRVIVYWLVIAERFIKFQVTLQLQQFVLILMLREVIVMSL